ncbi:MAG: hypothetical protein ACOC0A_05480, partial [Planctomycetota bacterium]
MSVGTRPCHHEKAAELVRDMRANDGLAPVDLDRFYADQEVAARDPFGDDIPQCPMGVGMNGRCVFDELGVEVDHWRYQNDAEWRLQLNRRYNDRAEKIIGRRVLNEEPPEHDAGDTSYPAVKRLGHIFDGEWEWQGDSWWLKQAASTPDELRA